MTTIVAGSAGSREKLSHGSAPEKDLAKYIVEYGYVRKGLSNDSMEFGGGCGGRVVWDKYSSVEKLREERTGM